MARRGNSNEAVQFKAHAHGITIPKAMMKDLISIMLTTGTYTTRSDFIIHSTRLFNEFTLNFILENTDPKGRSIDKFREKCTSMGRQLLDGLEQYVDPNRSESDPKVTYSMTNELERYVILLNQHSWKFDSHHDYIRVAVAYRIGQMRKQRAEILSKSNALGQDFVQSTCFTDDSQVIFEGEYDISNPQGK